MSRNAATAVPIHELLTQRWSPYALDPRRDVAAEDVRALFEAARWTMSSYNAQPWRYIVAARSRDEATWRRILGVLAEGNQPWAENAPVLALGIAHHQFEHNGKPNKAAEHDLGAASAMLTVEATARGLHVHQMIGIEPDKARAEFGIEPPLEPLTALAIGHLGQPSDIAENFAKRDQGERQRKPVEELILAGGF